MNLKFGVIYAKSGQTTDDEFLSNRDGSPAFDDFLSLLGDKIPLKGHKGYSGGLDVNNDMTGTHTVFKSFEEHQVMFHVSTLLPFSSDDVQQVHSIPVYLSSQRHTSSRSSIRVLLPFCLRPPVGWTH